MIPFAELFVNYSFQIVLLRNTEDQKKKFLFEGFISITKYKKLRNKKIKI